MFNEYFRQQLAMSQIPERYNDPSTVQARFVELFDLLKFESSAIEVRRKILRQHRPHWRQLKSTTQCFLCMTRPTERMMPCGHSACEECIHDYYPPGTAPYTYHVGECEFCGVDALTTLYCKPITVQPNVAAIDGGGVRGVVALVLLKRLQAALGTHQPISDYFDYFIGTSAGRVIQCGKIFPADTKSHRGSDRPGSRDLRLVSRHQHRSVGSPFPSSFP